MQQLVMLMFFLRRLLYVDDPETTCVEWTASHQTDCLHLVSSACKKLLRHIAIKRGEEEVVEEEEEDDDDEEEEEEEEEEDQGEEKEMRGRRGVKRWETPYDEREWEGMGEADVLQFATSILASVNNSVLDLNVMRDWLDSDKQLLPNLLTLIVEFPQDARLQEIAVSYFWTISATSYSYCVELFNAREKRYRVFNAMDILLAASIRYPQDGEIFEALVGVSKNLLTERSDFGSRLVGYGICEIIMTNLCAFLTNTLGMTEKQQNILDAIAATTDLATYYLRDAARFEEFDMSVIDECWAASLAFANLFLEKSAMFDEHFVSLVAQELQACILLLESEVEDEDTSSALMGKLTAVIKA